MLTDWKRLPAESRFADGEGFEGELLCFFVPSEVVQDDGEVEHGDSERLVSGAHCS